jgi:error-prone DNA polymerase
LLKCYYPDVFVTALLNSLPMGFYQPAEIVIDARKHGVEVRPVDVNFSQWDNVLEERAGKYYAIRLGFRQVRGMRQEDTETLVKARGKAFSAWDELRTSGLSVTCLERLADADAFRSVGMDRRQALWAFSIKDQPQALFQGQPSPYEADEKSIVLPPMGSGEHVAYDYATLGLSLKAHPISFVRRDLEALRITPASELAKLEDGMKVKVAGLVLVRQRPATASGVCFITIQDETGIANLVVWEKLFNKFRKEVTQSKLLMVEGKLQIEGEVIHVIANKCHDLSSLLRKLMHSVNDNPTATSDARQDKSYSGKDIKHGSTKPSSIQGKIFPDGRNFR